MLARAKEKNVYDALVQDELTEYLRNSREAFDLIVSADTLVYFGALEDIITAAAGALRPGGLLVFTLEHAALGNATWTIASSCTVATATAAAMSNGCSSVPDWWR